MALIFQYNLRKVNKALNRNFEKKTIVKFIKTVIPEMTNISINTH